MYMPCGALSAWLEFRPQTFSDTVRSRTTFSTWSLFFMIWHRLLPHGMDGCFHHNYFMFFLFYFMFSDFFRRLCFQTRWVLTMNFRDLYSTDFLPELGIIIVYVVLFCCRDWNSVIQIRKLEYFTHLFLCWYDDVLKILCTLKYFSFHDIFSYLILCL